MHTLLWFDVFLKTFLNPIAIYAPNVLSLIIRAARLPIVCALQSGGKLAIYKHVFANA